MSLISSTFTVRSWYGYKLLGHLSIGDNQRRIILKWVGTYRILPTGRSVCGEITCVDTESKEIIIKEDSARTHYAFDLI